MRGRDDHTAPALCMEEGDRILLRLAREIYYFLEITH